MVIVFDNKLPPGSVIDTTAWTLPETEESMLITLPLKDAIFCVPSNTVA